MYWEVYYITTDGFADQVGFKTKAECIKIAKEWAKSDKMEYVEVRAHNGEELIDDTEIIFKK